ncbi:MAG: DUF3822 family protein [Bacteroidales bacterium]
MYERELFDETLDINSTQNYEISIQVGLDGFSFCLLDILRDRFVMLRDYRLGGKGLSEPSAIMEIINNDEFLAREYRRYRMVFATERSTLVPATFFDPALKDHFFTLNYNPDEKNTVVNNKISQPDSFLLFDINRKILNAMVGAFPEASVSSHIRPLLYSSFAGASGKQSNHIRLHIEDTFFNLIIISGGKLKFFNSFSYRNATDLLYFTMKVLDQHNIGSGEEISLSGNLEYGDELYNALRKYVKELKFAGMVTGHSLSYIFESTWLHRYINLLNITGCA